MKPTEKLQADRTRHAKVVQDALDKTQLLKAEAGKLNALSSAADKDAYVTKVFSHHDAPGTSQPLPATIGNAASSAGVSTQGAGPAAAPLPSLVPPTQTLLANIKSSKTQVHHATTSSLHAQRAALVAQHKQLEAEHEKLSDKRHRKKTSLVAALQEDDRLEKLGPHGVVQEFLADGRSLLLDGMPTTVTQHINQPEDEDEDASDDDDDSDGEYESDSGDDDEDEEEDEGETEDTDTDWQAELDQALTQAKKTRRRKTGERATSVPIRQAQVTGNLIKLLREGGAEAPGKSLAPLVEVLRGDIQEQEQALHDLRVAHSSVATRLDWATRRPATYERHPTATAKQRAIKATCTELAHELISLAMDVVDMRPTLAQVKAEVHQWKATQALRLNDIARHVADSLLKDCVDELIAEVSGEVEHLQSASEGFASGLLVEAVAASQNRYGTRHEHQDTVRQRLQRAAEEQQALLAAEMQDRARLAAERETARAAHIAATAANMPPQPSVRMSDQRSSRASGASGVQQPDEEDIIMQDALARQSTTGLATSTSLLPSTTSMSSQFSLGPSQHHFMDASLTREERAGSLASVASAAQSPMHGPTWDATARQLPQRTTQASPGQRGLAHMSSFDATRALGVLTAHKLEDETLTADEQQHYLLSLRAMLHEMQRQRGKAPYGHTQQLTTYIPPGVQLTPAQEASVASAVPPLAARATVYAMRAHACKKCRLAVYPKIPAIQISQLETDFWSKVSIKPFFLGEKSPLVWVDKALGPVTCCQPSPQGTFLAVGTLYGGMLVYDVRNQPNNPWFQALGSGPARLQPPGPQNKKSPPPQPQRPQGAAPLLAMAWSSNGFQLATLDAGYTLRVWCLRPSSGQAVGEEPGRQPVLPLLAATVTSSAVATSGKAVLPDILEDLNTQRPPQAASWSLTFTQDYTALGCQPAVTIPQATGDLLRVALSMWQGPLLPAPKPNTSVLTTQAQQHGSSSTTSATTVNHAGSASTHHTNRHGGLAAGPVLSEATADFLLPPGEPVPSVSHQSLFRAHEGQVVYVGYLADGVTLVSVDSHGVVHAWPAHSQPRSGCGWYTPVTTWTLPRSIKAYQTRGPAYPVWPAIQTRSNPLPPAPASLARTKSQPDTKAATGEGDDEQATKKKKGGGLFGFGGGSRQAAQAPALQTGASLPPSYQDYVTDTELHDTADELSRLEEDPTGQWLTDNRLPWLVQYHWDTEEDKKGRLVRREIRRPHPTMPPGKPLAVTSSLHPSGQVLKREKQGAVLAKGDFRVVSASLGQGGADLVVWAQVSPLHGDAHAFSVLSAHVIHMSSGGPVTPRIDVYDHSQGATAPAFALSPPVKALGSEYMFVGLGCGVVGVHSVATGQLVRELYLGMPTTSPHFASLALFNINPAQGTCLNLGKMILAAVPSDSLYVHLFEIDDQLGTVDTVLRRPQPHLVRVLPEPGLIKQPSLKNPVQGKELESGLVKKPSLRQPAQGNEKESAQ